MIYYLGYFTGAAKGRQSVLAATNKMEYIYKSLLKCGKDVELVSCSVSSDKTGEAGCEKRLGERLKLRQFRTLGRKNKVINVLDRCLMKWQLFWYFIFHSRKTDTVIAYHSPLYCKVLAWLKRIKKWKLILEVEEIYGDVSGNARLRKRELQICKSADAFIFPTQLLSDAVNFRQKPYILIHGTYQVEPDRGIKFHDGKIHVVYAGTFDPRKGGATAAVATGEFLPENYHIHIIGFGSEKDKKYLLDKIEEVSKTSKCTVIYDGLKSGEEYIRFIQSCDIGLSTQNPDAAFNETSFPSKVLSYLANGLRVVSIRIKALEQSAVNDLLFYYDENSPQAIAEAIKKVKIDRNYDSRKRIRDLDSEFIRSLESLLRKEI